MSLYFGKYRAKVVDIDDPEERGRIRVLCPKVLGESKSAWCEPCIPVAGDFWGDFCLPKIDETIWVEFEEGSACKPIWTGNWYQKSSTPVEDYKKAGEIRVISFNSNKIEMKEDSLTISYKNAKIKLSENLVTISLNSEVEFNDELIARLNGLITELDGIQTAINTPKN